LLLLSDRLVETIKKIISIDFLKQKKQETETTTTITTIASVKNIEKNPINFTLYISQIYFISRSFYSKNIWSQIAILIIYFN
jgi:hypothetical protein